MPLGYTTNPFLAATDPAPIRAAVAWADSYDGKYGPVLKLSQVRRAYPSGKQVTISLTIPNANTSIRAFQVLHLMKNICDVMQPTLPMPLMHNTGISPESTRYAKPWRIM